MKRKHLSKWIKKNKYFLLLFLSFIVIFIIRIFISFQSKNFSYKGYENLFYVKYLLENGHPFIFNSKLVGDSILFLPIYYYLLSFFSLFAPIWVVAKVIPNLFASLIIFPTYLLVKEFTKNKRTSFFIGLLVSFVPIYFVETINSVTPLSLVIPIIITMFYLFIKIENKRYRNWFILFALISPLIHNSFFIVVITLLIYLFLLNIEKVQMKRIERDYILFYVFWFLWVFLLIHKNLLMQNSFNVLKNFFVSFPSLNEETNFLSIILLIGYIPFVNGLYSIYVHLFRVRNKVLYLMISLIIATIFVFILKGITMYESLIFIGFGLSIIFAEFYKNNFTSSKKNKINVSDSKRNLNFIDNFWGVFLNIMNKYKTIFVLFFYVSFILTAVLPSLTLSYNYTKASLTDEELIPFEILKEQPDGVVACMPFEEGAIKYLSNKEVLIGDSFLFQRDLTQKMSDLFVIYEAKYKTTALDVLTYYDVDYIFESNYSKEIFEGIKYTANDYCFEKLYIGNSNVYKIKCKLKQYR